MLLYHCHSKINNKAKGDSQPDLQGHVRNITVYCDSCDVRFQCDYHSPTIERLSKNIFSMIIQVIQKFYFGVREVAQH